MIQHRSSTWRDVSHLIPSSPAENEIRSLSPATFAPPVPVLSTTILQLELLLQESALDLAAISAVLLTDMGAVIQLLRASAADAPRPEDRTPRVGDCIASLGTDTWFNAVSALPYVRERNPEMAATAEHARTIAELARTLSSEFGLCPEDSYIVGLLHEIHNLPSILGWNLAAEGNRPASLKVRSSVPPTGSTSHLHQELWRPEIEFLPPPIAAALRETLDPRAPSPWRRLLHDAHTLAALSPEGTPEAIHDDLSRTRFPFVTQPRASTPLPRTSTLTPFFKPLQFLPRPPFLQPPPAVLLT